MKGAVKKTRAPNCDKIIKSKEQVTEKDQNNSVAVPQAR